MKRIALFFSFIVLVCALMAPATANAQKYQPSTTWPYLFENFQEGTICFDNGKTTQYQVNVHLLGNVLHYIHQNGKVFKSTDPGVERVEVGNEIYVPVKNRYFRLCQSHETAAGEKLQLLCESVADFDALSREGGAYGTSAQSSATQALASLDLAGLNAPDHSRMLQDRHEGRSLSMDDKYYILYKGELIIAQNKPITALLNDDQKAQLKAFVKQEKIKWSKPESLQKVAELLAKML